LPKAAHDDFKDKKISSYIEDPTADKVLDAISMDIYKKEIDDLEKKIANEKPGPKKTELESEQLFLKSELSKQTYDGKSKAFKTDHETALRNIQKVRLRTLKYLASINSSIAEYLGETIYYDHNTKTFRFDPH
jgi:hypothetical protein